ncbi:MAG TPA: VOC family protein [Actinomycetota bacterium]|nr:VOC family protein [Actinomycetota bacterium]
MGDGTNITMVATVGIPVSDQERAVEFYRDTLGFEVRMDVPFGEGMRWIEVAPVGSGATVALMPPGEIKPGVDSGIRLSTSNAEADHATMVERGVDAGEVLHFGEGVPPMFTFKDPDGNTLYVVESS